MNFESYPFYHDFAVEFSIFKIKKSKIHPQELNITRKNSCESPSTTIFLDANCPKLSQIKKWFKQISSSSRQNCYWLTKVRNVESILHRFLIPLLFRLVEYLDLTLTHKIHPKQLKKDYYLSPKSNSSNTDLSFTTFADAEERLDLYRSHLIGQELSSALELKEFFLLYQPQFSLKNQRLRGVEALIRWQNPNLGVISPRDFIPRLEKSGDIISTGYWVLSHACRQYQQWLANPALPFVLSINISAQQLQNKNFLAQLKSILKQIPIPPQNLELEVTESCILHDFQQAVYTLQQIQELGIKTAIDDFGTGYSSFSVLKELPLSTIKIDRSFIKDLQYSSRSISLVRNLINLSHDLDLEVIVEGVEEKKQMEILESIGCDVIQGYLIDPPLIPQKIIEHFSHYC